MEMMHSAILCLTENVDYHPLQKFLVNCNHTVSVQTGDDWPTQLDKLHADLLILFLNETDFSKTRELAILQKIRKPPMLVIFQNTSRQTIWPQEIFPDCDEFIVWPCHEQELRLRVNQLLPNQSNPTYDFNKNNIIEEFSHFNLIGYSSCFINTLKAIKKITHCDASVMIEGETGTGKELAARAIHYLGNRKKFPFIPLNCGALPDDLILNELFGHNKGAYTDAKDVQSGLVAQANGGTLFLDEIDSLSPRAQVILLRFLQDKKYLPLGGSVYKKANIRVIAASNQSLQKLVRQGCFRQDLFFRINIMQICMPPLRYRGDDVIHLAQHFMQRYRHQYHQPKKTLHVDSLHWMRNQEWHGNVRELENFIHREFLLSDATCIKVNKHNLPEKNRRKRHLDRRDHAFYNLDFNQAKVKVIADFEKHYLSRVMLETHGNVTQAAKRAAKERRSFDRLLKKYHIDKEQFRVT